MLEQYIENFSSNLTALREFVRLVGSSLESHEKTALEEFRACFLPVALAIGEVYPDSVPAIPEEAANRLRGKHAGEIVAVRRVMASP